MKITVCDRCGKKVGEDDELLLYEDGALYTVTKFIGTLNESRQIQVDLCRDCALQLGRFLKGAELRG